MKGFEMSEELETIPLAAYEAQASRFTRIIKYLIFGWVVSVVALGLVLVISLSYSDEVITETTSSEISQDSGDNGSNNYYDGDYYGYANDQGYDPADYED